MDAWRRLAATWDQAYVLTRDTVLWSYEAFRRAVMGPMSYVPRWLIWTWNAVMLAALLAEVVILNR